MTLERRQPTEVVPTMAPARPPLRERVWHDLQVRRRDVVAGGRQRARLGWRVARQLPTTVVLLVIYSPRGAWRLVRGWVRYLHDTPTAILRTHQIATAGERAASDLTSTTKVRSATLRARAIGSALLAAPPVIYVLALLYPPAVGLVAAAVGLVLAVRLLPKREWWELAVPPGVAWLTWSLVVRLAELVPPPPGWAVAVVGVGVVVVCGWWGRPAERALVPRTTIEDYRVPPLTAPMVTAALVSLGSSKMRNADDIKLLVDPHRRGEGMQVEMELPVPVTWVMENREELATILRRELGCVWPGVGPRHPGHLSLYVAARPMYRTTQSPWPLLSGGPVDLFRPVPVATDQVGRWVSITLAYSSGVIGAVPRMGKTFFLRELLLIAGLDPRARVYCFDGKGTGDLSPCAPYARYLGVGDEPEDIAEQLEVMRGLRAELRRRARVIRGLPREECPESKVTSALASRSDLGLEPIVVGVDETQVWFEYGARSEKEDKAIREEFAAICTDLVKRGPALGFIVLLATQQVNAQTVPTSISNNSVIRFALKMLNQPSNDQVLGTGARKAGIDAQMFSYAEKGIGYLLADGEDPRIVRTVAGLDAVAAEKVAARALALRVAAGTATDDDILDAEVVLDEVWDCARAMTDRGRAVAHLAELVTWLPDVRPDYAEVDVAELGKRLRRRGVVPRQVKVDGRNLTGVRLADLQKRNDDDSDGQAYQDEVA